MQVVALYLNNTLVNTGLIHGGRYGIDAYGLNTIVNSGTVIADTSAGIYASFSSVVYNAGAIEAGGSGIGILSDNDMVTNSGSIRPANPKSESPDTPIAS